MALPAQVATGAPITSTDHNALIPLILRVREEQAANTAGGGFTSGSWAKRGLNTVALNEITGASMASSVITLPAGVYNVEAYAAGFAVLAHKIRLRQTSGTPADLLIGSSENNAVASQVQTRSTISGRITLAGSTTIELQHQCTATKTVNGLGVPTNVGVVEVYAEACFVKVG